MFDEPIIRAEIKPKFSWLTRLIIMLPIFLLLLFFMPVSQKSSDKYEFNEYTGSVSLVSYGYNRFGDAVLAIEGTSNILSSHEIDISKIHLCLNAKSFIHYSAMDFYVFVKKQFKKS